MHFFFFILACVPSSLTHAKQEASVNNSIKKTITTQKNLSKKMWVIQVTLDYKPNHKETLDISGGSSSPGNRVWFAGILKKDLRWGAGQRGLNFFPLDMPLSYLTPFKNGIPIAYMIYSMTLVFTVYCCYMRPRCLDVGINIVELSYTTAVP